MDKVGRPSWQVGARAAHRRGRYLMTASSEPCRCAGQGAKWSERGKRAQTRSLSSAPRSAHALSTYPGKFGEMDDVMSALHHGQGEKASFAVREALKGLTSYELEQFIGLVEGKHAEQAVVLLATELWSRNSLASTRLCSLMMRKLVQWRQLGAMLDLYRKMRAHKIEPDSFTSSVLLLSCARGERIAEMDEVLRHLGARHVNDRVLAVVLAAYHRNGKTKRVLEVFSALDRTRVSTDRVKVVREIEKIIEGSNYNDPSTTTLLRSDLEVLGLSLNKPKRVAAALRSLDREDLDWFMKRLLTKGDQKMMAKILLGMDSDASAFVAEILLKALASKGVVMQDELLEAIVRTFAVHGEKSPGSMERTMALIEEKTPLTSFRKLDELLKAMNNANLTERVEEITDELIAKSSSLKSPDAAMSVLSYHRKHRDHWATHNLFMKMVEAGVGFRLQDCVALMNRFLDARERALARRMAKYIDEHPIYDRTSSVVEVNIRMAMQYKDSQRVLDLVEEGLATGLKVSDSGKEYLLMALASTFEPMRALASLQTYKVRKQEHVERLMQLYLDRRNFAAVETIFASMEKIGLEETKEAHSIRLQALALGESGRDLLDAVYDMKEAFALDPQAGRIALNVLIGMGNFVYANELYTALVDVNAKVDRSVYKGLAELATQAKNRRAAFKYGQLFELATLAETPINAHEAHMLSMKIFSEFGDYRRCVKEFTDLGQITDIIPPEAYRYPYMAEAKLGNWLGLEMFVRHRRHNHVRPDREYFVHYLRAKAILRSDVPVQPFLEDLRVNGVRPDATIFMEMMRLKMSAREYSWVDKVFQTMVSSGVKPDLDHHALLVVALLRRETLMPQVFRHVMRKTLMCFEEAAGDNPVELYKRVISFCVEYGETQTLRLFTEKLISQRRVSLAQSEELRRLFEDRMRQETANVFGATKSIFDLRPLVRWTPSWK
ncbi:hypothetical protein NDN08_005596 [Rhodosorus marinus]|uniref:Pentacotripeptide-repeat region of PRORP domain-containing protein n=1 Tax=Rhodosorus marinus TaxID=101924 RepID=A0AAV8V2F6_9RHOD|nr:hypothetical protein NDN08_005596 [Rhodosorus marinus]